MSIGRRSGVLLLPAGFALVVLALVLRLWPISTQPYWMDEGYTILAIEAYATQSHASVTTILPSGEPYQCFLYCYPVAKLVQWFGDSPWVFRLPAVLYGLLSIGLLFLVASSLYGRSVGFVAAALIATSALHIAWSVQVRWYTLFLCLVWLGVWAAVRLWQANHQYSRVGWMIVMLLSTAVATAVQTMGIAILGVMMVWVTLVEWLHKKGRKCWLIGVLLVGMTLVSLLVYKDVLSAIRGLLESVSVSYTLPYYLGFLVAYYWPLLPFAFYATYRYFRSAALLWAIFGSVLLPLAFLSEIVHYRYLFVVTPVIFILSAVGLWEVYQGLRQSVLQRWAWLLWVVVGVTYIASGSGTIIPQAQYLLEQDRAGDLIRQPSYAHTPQPNWNRAYEYLAEKRQAGDVVISTQPVFTYLFLGEPGYWLAHSYLGFGNDGFAQDGLRERYVGAMVVRDKRELQALVQTQTGFVVLDAMARAGRLDPTLLAFLEANAKLVFFEEKNHYSAIWVYAFNRKN